MRAAERRRTGRAGRPVLPVVDGGARRGVVLRRDATRGLDPAAHARAAGAARQRRRRDAWPTSSADRCAPSNCDPDFITAAWHKLLVNAVAGLMVLTGRKSGMFRRDDVAALARRYLTECLAVARADGANLGDDVIDESSACSRESPEDITTSILTDREAGQTAGVGHPQRRDRRARPPSTAWPRRSASPGAAAGRGQRRPRLEQRGEKTLATLGVYSWPRLTPASASTWTSSTRAPFRFVSTVDLAITPEQLFEVLADAESWPQWATVITKVVWTSPEPARRRHHPHGQHARQHRRRRGVHRVGAVLPHGLPVQREHLERARPRSPRTTGWCRPPAAVI